MSRDADDIVLLKVIKVDVCGPMGHVTTYALCDEGSSISLIDSNVAKMVGATGPVRSLRLHGARGMCASETSSQQVRLTVKGIGSAEYPLCANTVRELRLPPQWVAANRGHRAGQVKSELVYPKLLIGMDHARLIVSREVRELQGAGKNNVLSRTALGWVQHGTVPGRPLAVAPVLAITAETVPTENALEALVRSHFAIDSLGVTAAVRVSAEDVRANQLLAATTVQLASGQWATGLLWKRDDVSLPPSRQCALNRLYGIERKMAKDAAYAAAYRGKIAQYVERGYARALSGQETAQLGSRHWYLPHFAVFNPRKPGKIRVVFDAASKCRGVSLNDVLLTGPDLLSSLLGNIWRFREGRIALAADVQDMFLRIKIREADQEAQLFLWRNEGEEPKTYKMSSMVFGATCSPTSAQFVRNKIAEASAAQYPAAAAAIRHNCYMDDYLDATDSIEEAVSLARDVTEVLRRGEMHLANWASNSPEVLDHIAPHLRAIEPVQIIGPDTTTERVLGITWEPASDKFIFKFINLPEPEADCRPTKRELLSQIMQIFDPVGFLSCLMIRSKILLQSVWRSKVGWDQRIEPEHAEKWRSWLRLLRSSECKIARQSISSRRHKVSLHIFCDASEQACCAAAYFVENINGHKKVVFIAAKSKVAPLKPLSIPRLELQAALIAARLAASIRAEHTCTIESTTFWTDSTTVLCWLRTDPRSYSAFVANRLGEIDELTHAASWRWVPTRLNCADIGTRDNDPPDLSPNGPWFGGPAFLQQAEDAWPRERRPPQPDPQSLERRPATFLHIGADRPGTGALPDIRRFSSWSRLLRATAWVRRFIDNCRRAGNHAPGADISADERDAAERAWIRRSQADSFGSELGLLQRGAPLPRTSRLYAVTPRLDSHGLIRMDSRLSATTAADIPPGLREPIVLDGGHAYTRLVIRQCHERRNHPGPEVTVSDIRQDYFVLRLRPAVRRVHFECQRCRIGRSKPQPPLMGQLPDARLAHHQPAFTHCGVDYFGPLQVAVGRRREKRYGALFTCMTTRAVHLELADSLSSDSAIMALRRLAARRGHPRFLYSDNGTNFKGAAREIAIAIQELQADPAMRNHLAQTGVEWRFNPPLSPHMGGVWESLVRSVKRALEVTLKERAPRTETLLTAFAEAENVVNSRPLTHVSVDPRDGEPLTPNHLLLNAPGRHSHLAVYGPLDEKVCLRKQWQFAQQLADMFWRRWMREYLPTLAHRRKWQEPTPPIREGETAIIADPNLPRNSWPRGIIVEATPAADGQVRTVRLRTPSGDYVRPAARVIVLPTKQENSPTD